ncbi:MAG: GatB/YqeY domain-containing protein [Bacilli bacterium]|nr:GatB/YqeY domain-containing protein [Bacilli bacterium]
MLIDELKKANILAMKSKDKNARACLSVVINKYMLLNIENRKNNIETTDADVVKVIQKVIKELQDEKKMFLEGNREDSAKGSQYQIDFLTKYLPKMMSEEEIRKIIDGLEDKSMKNVMTTFKKDYAGQVDMSLVSKIVRSL